MKKREESIEEVDEEQVENNKHKGTAGLIEIDNLNLAKPKSIKAKDVDVDKTDLSWHESEELEKHRKILYYRRLKEEVKTQQEVSGCNSSMLASSIVTECPDNITPASAACCASVLPTVDIIKCLCMVADEPDILDAGITSRSIFRIYIDCGGKRRANDNAAQRCDESTGGHDGLGITRVSPPPPEIHMPEEGSDPVSTDHGLKVAAVVGTWTMSVLFLCSATVGAIYIWRAGMCVKRAEPTPSEAPNSSVTITHSTPAGGETQAVRVQGR